MVPAGGLVITVPIYERQRAIREGREGAGGIGGLHFMNAGLVSGDISTPRPTTPRMGDQAVPAGRNRSLSFTEVTRQHAPAPGSAPRAVLPHIRRRPPRP